MTPDPLTSTYMAEAPGISRYVRSQVANRDDAADIAAGVWERMVRLAATDANATITPALATTCARNAVIDYYRWHGRWNLCELSFTLAAYDNTERAATNVLLAQHILRLLPPRWATVLRLRYMEELSIEETAAVMGIPTGSVKSSASLAKAAARVLLGIDPVPPPRTFPHRNLGTRCKHD